MGVRRGWAQDQLLLRFPGWGVPAGSEAQLGRNGEKRNSGNEIILRTAGFRISVLCNL